MQARAAPFPCGVKLQSKKNVYMFTGSLSQPVHLQEMTAKPFNCLE